MEITPSRYRWSVWALFALALAVRIGVTARFQGLATPPDETSFPDQLVYDSLASQLSLGLGYTAVDGHSTAVRPPGTSLTLLPVYLVFGRNYVALRLWICLVSAATVPALAWFARRAFGSLAALCGAAVLALDPGHFYYAQHLVSEVPYCLFATLATGSALRAFEAGASARARWGWSAATGLLSGFATLSRAQFLFVPALIAAGALVARERRRLFPQAALQAGVFVACVAPWIVRNAIVMGIPTLTTLSGTLFLGVHNEIIATSPQRGAWMRPDPLVKSDWPTDEVGFDRRCWAEGFKFIRTRTELMPGLVYNKYRRLLSPYAGTSNALLRRAWAGAWMLTAPLFIAGLVLAWRRNRASFWISSAHFGGVLLLTLIFCGPVRFRHSVNPQIAGLVGLALAASIERVRRARSAAGRDANAVRA